MKKTILLIISLLLIFSYKSAFSQTDENVDYNGIVNRITEQENLIYTDIDPLHYNELNPAMEEELEEPVENDSNSDTDTGFFSQSFWDSLFGRSGDPLIGDNSDYSLDYEMPQLPSCGPAGEIFSLLLLSAAIAGLLFVIIRLLHKKYKNRGEQSSYKETDTKKTSNSISIEYEKLFDEAQKLYSAGDYKNAVITIHSAVLAYLISKKLLKYEKSTTLREYVIMLSKWNSVKTLYSKIVRIFEPVYYGNYITSQDDYLLIADYFLKIKNEQT